MHGCVSMCVYGEREWERESLRLGQFPVKSLLEWAIEVKAKVAKLRIKFFLFTNQKYIHTHNVCTKLRVGCQL